MDEEYEEDDEDYEIENEEISDDEVRIVNGYVILILSQIVKLSYKSKYGFRYFFVTIFSTTGTILMKDHGLQ